MRMVSPGWTGVHRYPSLPTLSIWRLFRAAQHRRIAAIDAGGRIGGSIPPRQRKGTPMTDRMLEGQVALVTGAGRGLGRAFAERLAALGCHIAVHGMREHGPSEYGGTQTLTDVARAIAETHRVRTTRLLGDLTRMDDIERVVGTATSELGPIDILVHNAGGDIAAAGGKPDPNDVVHIKAEDVRAVLDRNLLSTIFVCQQVARGMMQRRRGRIITIGSVAAFKGRTNASIYATAKAGAMHFTRCLADQMRPYDVTVNTIAPGDTRTERFVATRAVDPTRMAEAGTLDRIATVDEVARVVEFFAGPLGAFVSGQVVRVDGGGQAWAACVSGRPWNALPSSRVLKRKLRQAVQLAIGASVEPDEPTGRDDIADRRSGAPVRAGGVADRQGAERQELDRPRAHAKHGGRGRLRLPRLHQDGARVRLSPGGADHPLSRHPRAGRGGLRPGARTSPSARAARI